MTFASTLPDHLASVQMLVNRCSSAESKKEIIVAIACHDAISAEDAELLIQANQLESA